MKQFEISSSVRKALCDYLNTRNLNLKAAMDNETTNGEVAAIGFVNNWWCNGWLAVKLLCGLLLLAYQLYCGLLLRRFQNGSNVYSHRWYRVFNELPVLMMVAALYMVVFKPF